MFMLAPFFASQLFCYHRFRCSGRGPGRARFQHSPLIGKENNGPKVLAYHYDPESPAAGREENAANRLTAHLNARLAMLTALLMNRRDQFSSIMICCSFFSFWAEVFRR